MNTRNRRLVLALLCGVAFSGAADAAERMRPGQWVGTTTIAGKTHPTSSCVSQADATAMSGDAKAIQDYLETVIPASICKISDVKAQGDQVAYTATCGKLPAKVVTTSYRGDSSEGSDSTGAKTEAKLVGPCK